MSHLEALKERLKYKPDVQPMEGVRVILAPPLQEDKENMYKNYSKLIPTIGKFVAGSKMPYDYLIESIDKFYNQEEFSKKLIDDLIDVLINNLINESVKIQNFGTFKIIKKKQRIGRNPKTKENYIIKERNSVSFITSKKLLKIINK